MLLLSSVAVLGAVASRAEATLTGDFSAGESGTFCTGVCRGALPVFFQSSGFGDVQDGRTDNAGAAVARSVNFQDHFGLFARASANSTDADRGGEASAVGDWQMSFLIPAQQGIAAGTPGLLTLPYHLHGTIMSDWGETVFIDPATGPMQGSEANARFQWVYSSTASSGFSTAFDRTWVGPSFGVFGVPNFNVALDFDVALFVPFRFGEVFDFFQTFSVRVEGFSLFAPSVGFVEADLLQTATLRPAIVTDDSGNPLVDPIIISDTGFDFATLQPPGASVPEPAAGALLALGLAVLGSRRRRHRAPDGGTSTR
jgi:hypothetical protein